MPESPSELSSISRERFLSLAFASVISHDGKTIYSGLEDHFLAGRYHSLIVERETLPQCLEVSAYTTDDVIMGLRHRQLKVEGVQFHPESILTTDGKKILANFLK